MQSGIPMLKMCSFDAGKSTKGASKLRRDLINAEIANLRDLLPLPASTRQRLSQLQLMALVCVYVRKANYFQQVFKRLDSAHHEPLTPSIGFSKALSGFLMMMTQNGKLLYISDNAAEYLGHSMEDLLIHGDSAYDLLDRQDHAGVQSELLRSGDDERLFLCRMNVSRNARRQMRFGDQKVVLVQGHFLSFLPLCSRNEPVFLATCTPVAMPETRECVVQGATNVFTSIHSMDMKFLHLDKNGEFHLGFSKAELHSVSWYQLLHWECMTEAKNKHKLITQSEQDRSCILLLRLQRRLGDWLWVHCVLQVKDNMENSQNPVIVCTNQVLSEREASVMLANSWLYQHYTMQSKLQYGLALEAQAQAAQAAQRGATPGAGANNGPSGSLLGTTSGGVAIGGIGVNSSNSGGTFFPTGTSVHPAAMSPYLQDAAAYHHQYLQHQHGSPTTPSVIAYHGHQHQQHSNHGSSNGGYDHQVHHAHLSPGTNGGGSNSPDYKNFVRMEEKFCPDGQNLGVFGAIRRLDAEPVDYSRHGELDNRLGSDSPYLSHQHHQHSVEDTTLHISSYTHKRKASVLDGVEDIHSRSPTGSSPRSSSPPSEAMGSSSGPVLVASTPTQHSLSAGHHRLLKSATQDPADLMEQWNPSPPWSDSALQRVPDLSHQELTPYVTPTPPTPTGTPGFSACPPHHAPYSAFSFDVTAEQYVPSMRSSSTGTITPVTTGGVSDGEVGDGWTERRVFPLHPPPLIRVPSGTSSGSMGVILATPGRETHHSPTKDSGEASASL